MISNSVRKGALCAVGFAALAAMSASSFAQSTEYRRGYDQGYRDGVEAQSQQGQPAGQPRRARIVIEEASYGSRDVSCDARDSVQQAIGWRRNVSVVASNDLCGDPAPQRPKRLVIAYRCGDGPVVNVRTREGGTITMNCR